MTPIRYNIEASLGSIVRRAERAMINRLNQKFNSSGYDITTEQYRVLVTLWNNDGQKQQELAEATYKNKTTLTRLINNLEKRNLVVRVPVELHAVFLCPSRSVHSISDQKPGCLSDVYQLFWDRFWIVPLLCLLSFDFTKLFRLMLGCPCSAWV